MEYRSWIEKDNDLVFGLNETIHQLAMENSSLVLHVLRGWPRFEERMVTC